MSLLPSRPDASPAEDAEPRVIGVDSEDADEVLSALSSETARELLAAVHDEPAPPSELADRADTSLQNAQYHLDKLQGAGAVEVVDTAYSAKGREMDVYAASDQPLVIFAGDQEDGSMLRSALTRLLGALGLLAVGSLVVQALFGRLGLSAGVSTDSAPPEDGSGGAGGGDRQEDSGGEIAGSENGTETATPEVQGSPTPEGTPTPSQTPAGTPTQTETPMTLETATPTPLETPTPTEEMLATVAETATEGGGETIQTAAAGGQQAAGGLPPGLVFFAGGVFVLAAVGLVWYVSQ